MHKIATHSFLMDVLFDYVDVLSLNQFPINGYLGFL